MSHHNRNESSCHDCDRRQPHNTCVTVCGKPGPMGPRGPRGEAGCAGAPGRHGRPGPMGPRGPRGEAGCPGAPGRHGRPGSVGPMGPMGPRGPRGEAGCAGAPGRHGRPGPKGEPGCPGRPGPMGPRGPRGEAGCAGAPGRHGRPGPMGPRGPRGRDGRDGADGIFDTYAYLYTSFPLQNCNRVDFARSGAVSGGISPHGKKITLQESGDYAVWVSVKDGSVRTAELQRNGKVVPGGTFSGDGMAIVRAHAGDCLSVCVKTRCDCNTPDCDCGAVTASILILKLSSSHHRPSCCDHPESCDCNREPHHEEHELHEKGDAEFYEEDGYDEDGAYEEDEYYDEPYEG